MRTPFAGPIRGRWIRSGRLRRADAGMDFPCCGAGLSGSGWSGCGRPRREDVLRRLAELAFGRANDGAGLALRPGETDPEGLDLSAVSELKVTDKGVEVKFVDRVRALETLWNLLESGGDGGAEELYRALEDIAGQMEDMNG